MTYKSLVNTFAFRHAVTVSTAVLIAIICQHYFSLSHECWMILTAFLVGQTTRGTPFRQGLHFFLIILGAIVLAAILQRYIIDAVTLTIIAAFVFLIGIKTLFWQRPLNNPSLFFLILFPSIFLLAMYQPIETEAMLYARMADTAFGGLIGILVAEIIFPIRIEKEFRHGLVPLLTSLSNYLNELIACLGEDRNRDRLNEQRDKIEIRLQTQEGKYPEWVYEVGFNPGLRSGFRFFLITLERITEIFFSLDYLSRSGLDGGLVQELFPAMEVTLRKNIELLQVLIQYFTHKKITSTTTDYVSDMKELETTFQKVVPVTLEMLDLSPEYLKLTAFVRDIKDMRELLLQLVLALPTK